MTHVPATTAATPVTTTDRTQLRQAARQFEAILLRQMLAEARKADFGDTLFSDSGSSGGGPGGGSSGGGGLGTFREMMDSHFADIAAQTGSLGLGKLIETQLARLLPAEAKPAETKP